MNTLPFLSFYLPGLPLAVDVDTLPVATAAAGVDNAVDVVAREMRSAVSAAAGAPDDREMLKEDEDEGGVAVVVLLADGDDDDAVVGVETSASISELTLAETSPAAAAADD